VFSLLGVYTLNPDSTNLGEPQSRAWCSKGAKRWFKVYLQGSQGAVEDARRLDLALRADGHRAWVACDEEGQEVAVLLVRGPLAGGDLERLMRLKGLGGYCLPLGDAPIFLVGHHRGAPD
jgi:hypothetical protein